MKIKIGPYLKFWGPYQVVDSIFFWCKNNKFLEDKEREKLEKRWDYKLKEQFGDWLADTWVNDFLQKVYNKRTRKISIKIDKYDTWNAHNTASLILLPLLEELQKTKCGSGFIDDVDVPDELKSSSGTYDEKLGHDSFLHERYEWVLNEVLFALKADNDDWEDKLDYSNPKDRETMINYQNRINNGFRLMGKYWQTFWS